MTRMLTISLLASSALVPSTAFAQTLPTGGSVTHGEATIHSGTPSAMTIRQGSDRAVIDWSSFSVAEGARIDIVQNDARSALLNRVTGNTTSTIAGQVSANGQVYLVNPNGILITPTGTVRAAGFVASTLDMSDAAFMSGENIVVTGRGGHVHNAGTISIVKGGYAALIGGRVDNSGTILAPLGKVALGSASHATLDLEGDGFLQIGMAATGESAGVFVPGHVVADGGAVLLAAGEARAAARGVVRLGGSIEARGLSGRNGSVTLTGGDIALAGATIDVSGATGGGSVRVGGDWQGGGALERVGSVRVDAASAIRADALISGNGGRVVLWSDATTRFAGSISARGAGTGSGGDVEVSGKAWLSYTGSTDLRGPGGFGNLLLDPYNVVISSGAQTTGGGFTANGDDSVINVSTLQDALATANVTVLTGSGGSQTGNITIAAPLTWSSGSRLTLSAAGSILVNAPVSVAGDGKLALTYNAGTALTGGLGFAGGRIMFAPGFANQSLSLNGQNYTLIRSMADLDGIDGVAAVTGGSINVQAPGRSGRYALAGDLDASILYEGALIGRDYNQSFTGTFAGLGNRIFNLTIQSADSGVGLFGHVVGGTIRDLGLVGGHVATSGYEWVGGLAGYLETGTVINVYNSGSVSGFSIVGGLIGRTQPGSGSNRSNIALSYATGAVTAQENWAGGLIGYGRQLTVTQSYATGAVTGRGDIGGLIGYNTNGRIERSYATGIVTSLESGAGGLIGNNGGQIVDSYATGVVQGVSLLGGLVGYQRGAISGSHATGAVTADPNGVAGYYPAGSQVGGLVGQADGGTITASYATGTVRGGFDLGGLIGLNRGGVSGSHATGAVSGLVLAGGLVGRSLGGTISSVYATGSVLADPGGTTPVGLPAEFTNARAGELAGGLIGQLSGGLLSQAYATGAVTGGSEVGGLIGRNLTNVSEVYATGTVSGQNHVGGLVGYNDGTVQAAHATGSVAADSYHGGGLVGRNAGAIQNAYATGAVSGEESLGGLVGSNIGSVDNAYALGSVSGSFSIGGLVGENDGTIRFAYATGPISAVLPNSINLGGLVGSGMGSVTNSYWDVDTSGWTVSAGGAGLTTANARNAARYGGFDFSGIWYQAGDMRPILRSEAVKDANGIYQISNLHQLQLIGADLAGSYVLTRDIDASATRGLDPRGIFGSSGFVPIGTSGTSNFSGMLDGANHVVRYLQVDQRRDYAGLIGYSTGQIQNIGTVDGSIRGANFVGGLVGINLGVVRQSFSSNAATGTYNVGGLAGYNRGHDTPGEISDSFATGVVNGRFSSGGLVGYNDAATILRSYATGYVMGEGGLVGTNVWGGAIIDSYWDRDTTGKRYSAGGTGLSTAELQAGAATGLGSAFSGGANGINPYLAGFRPEAVQAISGTATGAAGGVVTLYRDGTVLGTATIGANGYYYMLVDRNTLGSGGALGQTVTAYGAADIGGLRFDDGLTLDGNGNLSGLGIAYDARGLGTGLTSWTQLDAAYDLSFGAARGAAFDGLLAGAALTIDARGAFTVDRSFSQSGVDLAVRAAGTLTLGAGTVLNGRNIALSSDGTFDNQAGANALSASGRWLVRSAFPGADRVGGLTPDFIQYAAGRATAPAQATGNGFLYAIAPTVTVDLGPISKIYDGSTSISLGAGDLTLRGLLGGDTIDFTHEGATFGSADAGRNLLATLSGLVLTGARNAAGIPVYGYSLTSTTATNAGSSITPRPITIAADPHTRIYGSANPAFTFAVGGMGLIGGDALSGALTSLATGNADVGSYAIGLGTLSGGDNYSIAYTGAALTIAARPISIAADALSRVYGSANPALTYTIGGMGLVNGDTLSGALTTAATIGANVGDYAIGRGTLDAGSNYALTYSGAALNITARPISIAADALSRVYGSANPALTYTIGGMGLVNGDTLSGALTTAATIGGNIGDYAIGQGTLDAGSNYALTYTGAALRITARPISVAADTLSRVYGNANPALTYTIGGMGLVNGDTLSGTLTTAATIGANVGDYAISQGTLDAGSNYALTYTGAALIVTPRALAVVAKPHSRIYGHASGPLGYVLSGDGLYGTDMLTGALIADATEGSGVGRYAITQGTLSAGGNYTIAYTGADLSITPRMLIISADSRSRIYGDANPALTYMVGGDGLYAADQLAGGLAVAADGRSGIGTYAITQGNLTGGGNYRIDYRGALLAVTPRALVVTADQLDRWYGQPNPPLRWTVGGMGLVNDDRLMGSLHTEADPSSPPGRFAIVQGDLRASANYDLIFVPGALTVRYASVGPMPTSSAIVRDWFELRNRPSLSGLLPWKQSGAALPEIRRDDLRMR